MAFRDYSQQFAPVNVFGGLGKGLGEGLGAGVTKAIRRPLFKRLTDDFATKRQEQAQLANLAKLKAANPEAGALDMINQYPLFEQMMAADMAPIDARVQTAQNLFEMGDYDKARDYLLTEPDVAIEKGTGGKGPKDPTLLPNQQVAIDDLTAAYNNYLDAQDAFFADSQNEVKRIARRDAKKAMNLAVGEAVKVGVDPKKVIDSASQSETFGAKGLEMANVQQNILSKQMDLGTKVTQPLKDAGAKLNARSQALTKTLGEYKKLAGQLESLIKKFNQNPNSTENGQLFAQAVKTLGLAVEPGLQVTSSEVDLYSGENWATKLLEFVPTVVRAATGLSSAEEEKLEKAAADAANQNPWVLQRVLEQASTAIQKGMEAYQGTAKSLKEGLANSAVSMMELQTGFTGGSLDPAALDNVRSQAASIVGGSGVPNDLVDFTPTLTPVSAPTIPQTEEDKEGDVFETGYSQTQKEPTVNSVLTETIQEAAGNAAQPSSVIKGMKNVEGGEVTTGSLMERLRAKRQQRQP